MSLRSPSFAFTGTTFVTASPLVVGATGMVHHIPPEPLLDDLPPVGDRDDRLALEGEQQQRAELLPRPSFAADAIVAS